MQPYIVGDSDVYREEPEYNFASKVTRIKENILLAEKSIVAAKSLCNHSFHLCVTSIKRDIVNGDLKVNVGNIQKNIGTKNASQINIIPFESGLETNARLYTHNEITRVSIFSTATTRIEKQCKLMFENASKYYRDLTSNVEHAISIHRGRHTQALNEEERLLMAQIPHLECELNVYLKVPAPQTRTSHLPCKETSRGVQFRKGEQRIASIRKIYESLIGLAQSEFKDLEFTVMKGHVDSKDTLQEVDFTTKIIETNRLRSIFSMCSQYSSHTSDAGESRFLCNNVGLLHGTIQSCLRNFTKTINYTIY